MKKSTRKNISQREARRLQREVNALNERLRRFKSTLGHDYPGVHIGSLVLDESQYAKVTTAHKLGFATVLKQWSGREFFVYAVAVDGP